MGECQNGELEILTRIDKICKQLNLEYFLIYGTLLGAVRHHGFIPWDDDLDIAMPREDYAKFIDYFDTNADQLLPLRCVYGWTDKKYSYAMSRITDMNYKLVYTDRGPYAKEDMGLFVDVYPYDGMGNDLKSAIKIMKRSTNTLNWIRRATLHTPVKTDNKIKKAVQPFVYSFAKRRGKDFYHDKLISYISSNSYKDSSYVGLLVWDSSADCIFEKDKIEPLTQIQFNGRKFNAPKDSDYVLKTIYGNYMELPPVEQRVPTHYYGAYLRSDWEKENR